MTRSTHRFRLDRPQPVQAIVGPLCFASALGWAAGPAMAAVPAPTPATPAPSSGTSAVASIGETQYGALKVEPAMLDLGTILEGAEATARFTLTNTGADEIKILRAAPS